MHNFVTKTCQYVHISVTKWCIVGCLFNALWDWWNGFINCHKMGRSSPSPPDEGFQLLTLRWRHNGCDSVSNHQPRECLLSRAHQRKHQSSASLAFVRGIHRRPVNSPHKWPATRKMFPFDEVIMNITMVFPGMEIYTIKIRRSSLIFVMEIPLRHLYMEIIPKTLSVLRTDRKH